MHGESPAWKMFTFCFVRNVADTHAARHLTIPVEIAYKAYLLMGLFFLTGSTFTLAKTLRDEHEARSLSSKIESARAERLPARIFPAKRHKPPAPTHNHIP